MSPPSPLGAHYSSPLGAFYRTPLKAFGFEGEPEIVYDGGIYQGLEDVETNLRYVYNQSTCEIETQAAATGRRSNLITGSDLVSDPYPGGDWPAWSSLWNANIWRKDGDDPNNGELFGYHYLTWSFADYGWLEASFLCNNPTNQVDIIGLGTPDSLGGDLFLYTSVIEIDRDPALDNPQLRWYFNREKWLNDGSPGNPWPSFWNTGGFRWLIRPFVWRYSGRALLVGSPNAIEVYVRTSDCDFFQAATGNSIETIWTINGSFQLDTLTEAQLYAITWTGETSQAPFTLNGMPGGAYICGAVDLASESFRRDGANPEQAPPPVDDYNLYDLAQFVQNEQGTSYPPDNAFQVRNVTREGSVHWPTLAVNEFITGA